MKRQRAVTVCTFKPNSWIKGPANAVLLACSRWGVTCPASRSYSTRRLKNISSDRDSTAWWSTLLYNVYSVTSSSTGNPATIIIPTSGSQLAIWPSSKQSIAHYAISMDRTELEVRLIDEPLGPSHRRLRWAHYPTTPHDIQSVFHSSGWIWPPCKFRDGCQVY